MNNMNNKNVLLAVLAGVAAGALLGVLIAPNKGKAKRNKMFKDGEDYFGGLKDKYGDLLDRLNDKLEALKGEANQVSKY